MENLKLIPAAVLLIGIAAIIIGAISITIAQMQTTITPCYNSSYSLSADKMTCTNSTGIQGPVGFDNLNLSDSYYSLVKGNSANINVAQQFPTIGIVAVMVIVIGLIVSVFAYFQYMA